MKQASMTEREMMEDGLNSQKQMSSSYNTYASECTGKQLRSAFLNILAEEQDIGAQIFEEMSARGWYQTQDAGQSEISKTKEKFLSTN